MQRPVAANGLEVAVTRSLRTVLLITLTVVVDIFVQVVHTSKEHCTGLVGIAQSEASCLVAIIGAIACL